MFLNQSNINKISLSLITIFTFKWITFKGYGDFVLRIHLTTNKHFPEKKAKKPMTVFAIVIFTDLCRKGVRSGNHGSTPDERMRSAEVFCRVVMADHFKYPVKCDGLRSAGASMQYPAQPPGCFHSFIRDRRIS